MLDGTNLITSNETDEQFRPAISILKQFIAEMNRWEQQCYKDLRKTNLATADLAAANQKDLDAMNEIFTKYCTPKKRTNNHVGAYGNPPEYDPSVEKIVDIESVSKKKIIIYTQKELGARVKFKYRYTLMKKGDRWLIDNREWFGLNNKWEKAIL